MNNEETIINQPNKTRVAEQNSDVKENKSNGGASRVAATAAAGMLGGAAGGAGAALAGNALNTEEPEVQTEETNHTNEPATAHTEQAETPAPDDDILQDEAPVTEDDNGELDYTGQAGANPVAQNPVATPVSNDASDDGNDVQILGVYENEEGQELVVLTDGETIVGVLDTDGDGEADLIGVDENIDGQFEENEIHDISGQHVSMDMYEQAYIAQHPEIENQMSEEHDMMAAQEQMEVEQQDTFAYEATDESDYNNEAPVYDA